MNPIGYHVTTRVFLKSFQCSGIWFPDKVSYLYSFYAVVLYVFCSLLYVHFTVVHLCSAKSVAHATQALFMLTIVLSIAAKTTNLMFFNKRFRKLVHRLHNDFHLRVLPLLIYQSKSKHFSQFCKLSNKDFSSYIFLITFLLIQNGQIFLPCYYGNELILSSTDLSRQSYRSNWMDMTKASRGTFIYLLERLKRESQIMVGKLFSLSLETYTTVCMHTYRLFTLLQSMNA